MALKPPSSSKILKLLGVVALLHGTPFLANAQGEDHLYGQRIVTVGAAGKPLQAATADLQEHLRLMTAKEFRLDSEVKGPGIYLSLSSAIQAPAAAVQHLKGLGREPFVLLAEGTDRIWIVANGETGLSHGIYYYLDQLGVRWYFPSKKWTIVLERKNIDPFTSKAAGEDSGQGRLVRPAFRSRMFFGSGGFGGALPNDPRKELQARWETWQRRNRFGGEFLLGGHSGEAFNAKYKKILEANPDYLAMVDGKRRPWSPIVKFCASHPEVVDLFIKDRVDALRLQRRLDPEGPRSWSVSVEPSDGGGHCECPKCLAIGSPSDRVFHIANQVARAVDREFPGAHVNLYAYHEHAAVPKIPLEKNVYVMAIPYAFQRTDLSPDQLLQAWSKKTPRLGVYDYWSIPDWSRDLPTFDFVQWGPERLRRWHALKVDGFNAESTFSGGAMGPAWYVAGKLAWFPDTDPRRLLAEFYEQCFGPAKVPMQRMLERWTTGFFLTSHELGLSFRDVREAWKLSERQPAIQARVADYARYVQYLGLWFEYLQSPPRTDQRKAATLALFHHLWNIYDSSMVHAFRLSQLLARDESKADPEWLKRYDVRNPQAPGWLEIKPLADDSIPALIAAGVERYQPQGFSRVRYSGKWMPLLPAAAAKMVNYSTPMFPSNTIEIHVLAPAGLKTLPLRIACEKAVRVQVRDSSDAVIFNKLVETGPTWTEDWSEPEIALPGPGPYRVQIWSPRRTFRLSVPDHVPLVLPEFTNSQGRPTPKVHFYVPAGLNRLALYAAYTAAGPPRFFDPDGAEVKPRLIDGGKLLLVDIPVGQAGRIWSLSHAKAPNEPLRFLNAPQSFAFFPQSLLVPADAQSK